MFNSSLEAIFAVKKYAEALKLVIERKGIQTNFKHNLVEVKPKEKQAVFEKTDTKELVTFEVCLHYLHH